VDELSKNPAKSESSACTEGVCSTEKRRKTSAEIKDPALMQTPNIGAGRTAAWETRTPHGGYRGTAVPIPERAQPAMVFLNYLQGDPEAFQRKLLANIKDYARGSESFVEARPFFTERTDLVSAAEVYRACKDDGFVYRAVLRVYDQSHYLDVDGVRELMRRVGVNLGCRVAWLAAIHHKPTVPDEKNRHVHMIIRGVTLRNRKVRLSRAFRREGMVGILAAWMTEKAGILTDEKIAWMARMAEANADSRAQMQSIGWRKRWAMRRQRIAGASR
jgi:hypothetical protein